MTATFTPNEACILRVLIDTRQGSSHGAGWYRIVPLADTEGKVA